MIESSFHKTDENSSKIALYQVFGKNQRKPNQTKQIGTYQETCIQTTYGQVIIIWEKLWRYGLTSGEVGATD